ncbi:elongation factor P maturation arginine rhamnosyltransferase EarP, partial [Pseudomonas syringae pv. tagetis]|uniref:elongation factor P maturation arginine rhamnosyltransferase EarP n=1 Tax=Pseudomonas syringae group genomosp. 7 TaxID=251699 RepID=UPI00376FF173
PQAFQRDTAARGVFLQRQGVDAFPEARLMTVFAYENPAHGSSLDALASSTQPTHLLLPEGRILADLRRRLRLGHEVHAGN